MIVSSQIEAYFAQTSENFLDFVTVPNELIDAMRKGLAVLKDIASKAGVNVSTVSRALRGSTEIRTETRDRIARIAKELDYRIKRPRKDLPEIERSSIGILCPEVKSDYYGQLVNTIEKYLKAAGYHIVIGLSDFQYENESYYLDLFHRLRVGGIIFITSIDKQIERDLEAFKAKSDIPLIQVGTDVRIEGYDYVEIDDDKGVSLAVEHLVGMGHTKICYVGDLQSKVRVGSFRDTLQKHSLEVRKDFVRIGAERFEEGGYLRMMEILSLGKPLTAVFAAYDDMAIGAMRALYDSNLRVPDDVSVVGLDNIGVTGYLYKRLTTVSEPVHEMGELAARMLIGRITGHGSGAIQHVKLIPELVVRDSTSRAGSPMGLDQNAMDTHETTRGRSH
jgi:DNA-binding LacI/PurR family transcriptional regulator